MRTRDLLLAAFVATHNVPVRKVLVEEDDAYEFDLEENDALVAQFIAPDGYNCNIHKLVEQLERIQMMAHHVEVEETSEESSNS